MSKPLSGKFSALPVEAIRDHRLGVIDLRVLLALYSFKGSLQATEVFPSRKVIAERSGYAEGTVSRAMGRLVEYGWVQVKQHRGPNTYLLPWSETVPDPVTVTDPDTVTKSAGNCDRSGHETVTDPATPKESIKRHKEERGRKRAHPLPDTFKLTSAMQAWGSENFPTVNLQQETEKFADHARAKNRKLTDWIAGWRNWIRRAHDYQQARGNSTPHVAPKQISEDLY